MPEQQTTEYKSSRHDDYLKWICSFANAHGNLPEGMNLEKLKQPHSSKPRNLIIADVCFRGIEKNIMQDFEEYIRQGEPDKITGLNVVTESAMVIG